MNKPLLALLLAICASSAIACESFGTQGKISDNGQGIVARMPIPLAEQARKYGGYEKAAEYVENNRLSVINSNHFSESVKRQVDNDLTRNVDQLKCWVAVCSNNSNNPACHF